MAFTSLGDKPVCLERKIDYNPLMLRFMFLLSAGFLLGASSCAGTDLDHSADKAHSSEAHASDSHASDAHLEPHADDGHGGDDPHHKNSPRPYNALADAWVDLDATIAAAKASGKHAIIVMGANWCHDSRGLAFHFENPEFRAAHITPYFEQVYIDVGEKNRNIDIAQKFGLEDIKGTPTIFVLSSEGDVLNLDTAPTWRNAASRSKADIVSYFRGFRPQP